MSYLNHRKPNPEKILKEGGKSPYVRRDNDENYSGVHFRNHENQKKKWNEVFKLLRESIT